MKNSRKKVILGWIIFLIWLGMAIFLSTQDYSGSVTVSGSLARWTYNNTTCLFGKIPLARFHFYFRKVGHFIMHFGVGLFGLMAIWWTLRKRKLALLLALILGITIAIFDEVMQTQVAGRTPDLVDGIINITSVLAGLVAAELIF